ncbi:basic amino acid ABC transporter substrate-binding protein [Bacillus sp. 1P06AnD]|uniref:basic amino acid ABC transporter substrate-binding protein n=1 Tax=Bacillus sp. 1P06AnD TaxID=3132208 RepID=UPI0039A0B295
MKKFAVICMLFCSLLLVLSGCGSSGTSGSADKKTLRVVTDAAYSPMEYMDKDKVSGFDVDFIRAAAKEAGYKVKVEHVGWDPIFEEIRQGRADIGISAISINKKREKKYDFSVPYFISTNKILVPDGSSIKSGQDLKGKKVAVQAGTTGQFVTEDILGTNHKDIKKFENTTLAIMELTKEGADAVVADNAVIEEYAKKHPDEKLNVVADPSFDGEFYGLLFKKGNKDLKKKFDKAINTLYENGTYEKIYKKWLGTEPDIDTLKQQQEK